jgi:hypothetical protein
VKPAWGSPKTIGPPEVDGTWAEFVGKDLLFGFQEIGDVGVLGEVTVTLGGRVSQERVRRQLARKIEKLAEDIGSWEDV